MQKLNFDLGLKEYEIGGGVLRFNPGDPNVYARFAEAGKRLTAVEKKLVAEAEAAGEEAPGRKLGFIAQEMGREINTLGSKSNDSQMQRLVVQMKDELEKIKEQVLNLL